MIYFAETHMYTMRMPGSDWHIFLTMNHRQDGCFINKLSYLSLFAWLIRDNEMVSSVNWRYRPITTILHRYHLDIWYLFRDFRRNGKRYWNGVCRILQCSMCSLSLLKTRISYRLFIATFSWRRGLGQSDPRFRK